MHSFEKYSKEIILKKKHIIKTKQFRDDTYRPLRKFRKLTLLTYKAIHGSNSTPIESQGIRKWL